MKKELQKIFILAIALSPLVACSSNDQAKSFNAKDFASKGVSTGAAPANKATSSTSSADSSATAPISDSSSSTTSTPDNSNQLSAYDKAYFDQQNQQTLIATTLLMSMLQMLKPMFPGGAVSPTKTTDSNTDQKADDQKDAQDSNKGSKDSQGSSIEIAAPGTIKTAGWITMVDNLLHLNPQNTQNLRDYVGDIKGKDVTTNTSVDAGLETVKRQPQTPQNLADPRRPTTYSALLSQILSN